MMTALPHALDFDLDGVPSWKLMRSLRAELRGVIQSLHDGLRELRMITWRSGAHALTVEEIAVQIGEQPDVLERTLPDIMARGFAARDDRGALFSPHLYVRELRRQERQARLAEREERAAEIEAKVAAGILPAGATLKAVSAQSNGGTGGRPRKGETPEEARARRASERAQAEQRQREMALMRVMPAAGNPETKNPNQNPNRFSVSGVSVSKPVSEVSLDLEIERNREKTSISESSETFETEIAETSGADTEMAEADRDLLRVTVARVMTAAGFPRDSIGKQVPSVRKWLREGCPPDVIVEAVSRHTAAMRGNEDVPTHMGAFRKAIRAEWDAYRALSVLPAESSGAGPAPTAPQPEWERRARDDHAADLLAFEKIRRDEWDYGVARRIWAQKARELGRPGDLKLESYIEAYRPQEDAA